MFNFLQPLTLILGWIAILAAVGAIAGAFIYKLRGGAREIESASPPTSIEDLIREGSPELAKRLQLKTPETSMTTEPTSLDEAQALWLGISAISESKPPNPSHIDKNGKGSLQTVLGSLGFGPIKGVPMEVKPHAKLVWRPRKKEWEATEATIELSIASPESTPTPNLPIESPVVEEIYREKPVVQETALSKTLENIEEEAEGS